MNLMTIEELVNAVLAELKRLGYKQITIHNYEKMYADLIQFANDKEVTEYSTELSVMYLKEKHGIDLFYVTSDEYDKNSYFPIRACQCLTEWKLHKYIPLKKQGKLASQNMPIQFKHCYDSYAALCKEAGYSERGTYTRLNRIKRMLIFFNNKGVQDINNLTAEDISAFFKTQIELDSRTVATLLTSIRVFFRHLYQTNITHKDYTTKLPNIKANRNFKLPKTWRKEDVLAILNSIDRGNPVGKRDYAILMLITRYGLRSSDIKDLKLSNLRWDTNTIEIIQNKTRNPLQLPLIDVFSKKTTSEHASLVFPLLFRILIGCGLRISETLSIEKQDVDFEKGTLLLLNTKNEKERIIPMADSLCKACRKYALKIQFVRKANESKYFFPNPGGKAYAAHTAYSLFRQYLQLAGISHGGRGKGPRLHDLRHTFAVRALKKWVLEGKNLTTAMPYLSIYMGHVGLKATQHYVKLTSDMFPELIKTVEERFGWIIPEAYHERD